MVKADVCKEEVRREWVEPLLAKFVFAPLAEFKILFGGYSGTSVGITGTDGTKAVLKVCHGYTVEDVAAQAAICVHASKHGFDGICTALPVRNAPTNQFSTLREDGAACCLLSWVEGTAADKVISAGRVSAADVLKGVGGGLARLHSVPVPPMAACSLRALEAGGACDLRKHINGEIDAVLSSSKVVAGHDFLPFYARQLASLRAAVAEPGLPRGLLHGDPFLDNMLVNPSDGSFGGFVDLEDACVGPLLFDLACCASACCFREDGALDGHRLRALLTSYAEVRSLEHVESRRFVDFMKLTMLCNWCVRSLRTRTAQTLPMAHSTCARRLDLIGDPVFAAHGGSRISTLTIARLRAAVTHTASSRPASSRSRMTLSRDWWRASFTRCPRLRERPLCPAKRTP